MLCYSGTNRVVALGPVFEGIEDDEEVDVAVVAGVSARIATEEDVLFGIETFGDKLSYGANRGFVDLDLAHLHRLLLQRVCQTASGTVKAIPRVL